MPAPTSAQNFTLQAPSLSEVAVDPGGTSSADITVGTTGSGFSGTVDLTCQIAPVQAQTIVDPPACTVSPGSVTPPANASATITTMGDTSQVRYSVTITGTSASNNQTTTTAPLYMTVLDVAPQFTITVEKAVEPASVPAGSNGVTTVAINPINGYVTPPSTPGVTLSCNSITPLVNFPPVCSFSPNPVTVTTEGPNTSQLTIITYGPIITTGNTVPGHNFYGSFWALWLPLPMLAVVGLGAAAGGKRSRKAWGMLGLFVLSGTLFLMPACGNTSPQQHTPNGVTPNNTYAFTISGVDAAGNISSNAGSGSTNPTASLTVTTATTN
ncbi:MAG: hypothetical protein ACLPHP_03135 [Candidatus Sulfotelmatobacter sp.]